MVSSMGVADADTDIHHAHWGVDFPGERLNDAFAERLSIGIADHPVNDDDEFVTSESSDKVADKYDLAHSPGSFGQNGISGVMAGSIVYRLEAVKIAVKQGAGDRGARGAKRAARCSVHKRRFVRPVKTSLAASC